MWKEKHKQKQKQKHEIQPLLVSALGKSTGAPTFKGILNDLIKLDKESGSTFLHQTIEQLNNEKNVEIFENFNNKLINGVWNFDKQLEFKNLIHQLHLKKIHEALPITNITNITNVGSNARSSESISPILFTKTQNNEIWT